MVGQILPNSQINKNSFKKTQETKIVLLGATGSSLIERKPNERSVRYESTSLRRDKGI